MKCVERSAGKHCEITLNITTKRGKAVMPPIYRWWDVAKQTSRCNQSNPLITMWPWPLTFWF